MSAESSISRPEFDRSQYPELAACKIMPAIVEDTTEIEVTDAEGRGIAAEVPSAAVMSLKVPNFTQLLPQEVKKQFEEDLAAGLVACRIIERFEDQDLIKIELPTSGEFKEVLVPVSRLARAKSPETTLQPEGEANEERETEVTPDELVEALRGTVPDEDLEDIEGMELEDGLGYAFSLLLESGIEDPEEFLKEKGILE